MSMRAAKGRLSSLVSCSVQEITGQACSTNLVAQTIVFRRLRWQATKNDGLPRRAA